MTTNGVESRHRVQLKMEKFGQKTMVVGKEERSRRRMKLEVLQHRRRLRCRSQPTRMLAPVLALPISMQKTKSQPTRMMAPELDRLSVALPIIMQKKERRWRKDFYLYS